MSYEIKEYIEDGGKRYYPSSHYTGNRDYELTHAQLQSARKHGLPYRRGDGNKLYYYNEDDFHAYYAGEIGDKIKTYDIRRTATS